MKLFFYLIEKKPELHPEEPRVSGASRRIHDGDRHSDAKVSTEEERDPEISGACAGNNLRPRH
jgi:hypothetical protein